MRLTESDLRALVARQVAVAGSQRALAERLGVSATLVGRYLAGRGPCPPAIASALGYRREVAYRRA